MAAELASTRGEEGSRAGAARSSILPAASDEQQATIDGAPCWMQCGSPFCGGLQQNDLHDAGRLGAPRQKSDDTHV